jgi:hypothetical protein
MILEGKVSLYKSGYHVLLRRSKELVKEKKSLEKDNRRLEKEVRRLERLMQAHEDFFFACL